MAVSLGYEPVEWPALRLWTKPTWGVQWSLQPMARTQRSGFTVRHFTRRSLPDTGDLVMTYEYGRIDERLFIGSSDVAPDILDHYVRLQLRTGFTESGVAEWETVWLGRCLAQPDRPWPGADVESGTMTYHCRDLIYDTADWTMDRHQAVAPDRVGTFAASGGIEGHPGYNIFGLDGMLHGNRYDSDPAGLGYKTHTRAGNGDLWTDREAVDHALASAIRPDDAPDLSVSGSTDLMQQAREWEIKPGQSVLSFLKQVFNRRRSLGLAVADWSEASGASSAPDAVDPTIRVRPQFADDIEYQFPDGGGTATAQGATSAGTAVTVDLIGDHRINDRAGDFILSKEAVTNYQRVETLSDRILVVGTLGGKAGDLAKRHSDDEEAAFEALTGSQRIDREAEFSHVFRQFGLPYDTDFTLSEADTGSNPVAFDYQVEDDGDLTSGRSNTSPVATTLEARLPIPAGYLADTNESDMPDGVGALQQVGVWRHRGDDTWTNAADGEGFGVEIIDDVDLWLEVGSDTLTGGRTLGITWPLEDWAVTVAIRLPHRVRYATGQAGGRTKRVYVPGFGLHVVHPHAILAVSDGSGTPVRSGTEESPTILRDDRDALQRVHRQVVAWYQGTRRTAQWSLAACGFAGQWVDADDNANDWQKIGELVTEITYNGRTETVNTPITSMRYDHTAGVTTWATSWVDRDFR